MRTSLTRWNPVTRSPWLGRDPFVQFMDNFFQGEASQEVSNRSWSPAVDIRETEEAFLVHAELPGLSKDDVEITLENNILKLTGERRFEKDVEEKEYHRIERAYGAFTRAFSLPSRVDSNGVSASFADGVLTITVPKVEEAKPRRIEVK
ncbi:MAG TPA: Hsp20/alpha crystallin family protein [Thermoanaerobaculia bacterium]|nr:Hsp20/alpha crystallin family protein [Thermoanaerobaculia bacterium]